MPPATTKSPNSKSPDSKSPWSPALSEMDIFFDEVALHEIINNEDTPEDIVEDTVTVTLVATISLRRWLLSRCVKAQSCYRSWD